jgi:predicted dehydrogenase
MSNRREFIQKSASGVAGLTIGTMAMSAKSYGRIIGANDSVKVGILGFSGRFESALGPAFQKFAKEMNFEFAAVCDLWNKRRQDGINWVKKNNGTTPLEARNTDEFYNQKMDAVIVSTADFQHALLCGESVRAGMNVYCEKPFAETMDDAIFAKKAVNETGKVVQIGSQRRSGANYQAAHNFIQEGKFGKICAVEMTWNVNQPGRWRRPAEVASIKESDTDWKRFLMNRPVEKWDPRKYLEFRLFWPYSSGIPGQWMAHQIDTVHWFTGLSHPRNVAANGGIYQWQDGRTNADTLTAVFDYGPPDNAKQGFQVVYTSRFTNSAGGTKELYYSNSGMMNLDNNTITPEGGLQAEDASAMNMQPNLLKSFKLPEVKAETGANTNGDPLTSAHMRNWMECVRSRKQTNAPVEAGYNHAIACIMANAAYRTGMRSTFDETSQEVMAGGKVFTY